MKRLLFVCIENANRSQMAQAFATIHGGEGVEAFSAGSRPSGIINAAAIASMAELGYDLATHSSKSIDEFRDQKFDAVITMGCGDDCPFIECTYREDWQIPDPRNMDPDQFRLVRNQVELQVRELLTKI